MISQYINAEHAYREAVNAQYRGELPEAKSLIATEAKWAYLYAKNVLKGRFHEGEPAILQSAKFAYFYARDIKHGRWPEAEGIITTDAGWSYYYAIHVLRHRFPQGHLAMCGTKYWILYKQHCNLAKISPTCDSTLDAILMSQ